MGCDPTERAHRSTKLLQSRCNRVLLRHTGRSSLPPMARSPLIRGIATHRDAPHWAPLESAVGRDLLEWFMWMFEVALQDGVPLHAYKHVTTRCYLHLTDDGRAFEYRGRERYAEVRLAGAIAAAFTGWGIAEPPADHVRAVHAAVRAARGRERRPSPEGPADEPRSGAVTRVRRAPARRTPAGGGPP